MLINSKADATTHVRFVSYDGRYPALCHGRLCLNIDGVDVHFSDQGEWDGNGNYVRRDKYARFWESGGSSNWRTNSTTDGEWLIDVSLLPEEYTKYAAEIDEVFNANVQFGCCGGCM